MLEVFLALALLIAVTILLTQLIFRRGAGKLMGQLEARVRAGEQIVNMKTIPEDWLRPYQERAVALCRSGGNTAALTKAGVQAKKRCMRRLDELIHFYEYTSLVDSGETRQVLLTSLREQRARWETLDWVGLLATGANETP